MAVGVADWVWLPHPAHFVGAQRCQFRLATYVNGVIVSTIGEYLPQGAANGGPYAEVGIGRHFETMVFPAALQPEPLGQCCPWAIDGDELECIGYESAHAARLGHYALCFKYAQADRS